jgi:hypothetical protein
MMMILHAEHGGGNNSAFTCRSSPHRHGTTPPSPPISLKGHLTAAPKQGARPCLRKSGPMCPIGKQRGMKDCLGQILERRDGTVRNIYAWDTSFNTMSDPGP